MMSIFGIGKKEKVWRSISEKIGGEYIDNEIVVKHKDFLISLDTYYRDGDMKATRIRESNRFSFECL